MRKFLQLWLVFLPLFTFSCRSTYLAKVEPDLYAIGSDTVRAEDAAITALIAPYKQELDVIMDEKIGESTTELLRGRPESPLGNWLGDAVQAKAEEIFEKEVDFSFLNYGGVRIPALPAGAITKRHIYELMPFDNTLVLVYLDAPTLRQLIDHMAADSGWPVSRELHYRIEAGKAKDITIDGAPIHADKTYLVAMPDYIANGGSDSFFLSGLKREDKGLLIRDLLIARMVDLTQQGEKISAEQDGRVVGGDGGGY